MASVSASQPAIGTPLRSPEGGRGAWNYSVPVSGEEQPSEDYSTYDNASKPAVNGARSSSSQANGPTRPTQRRTNTLDSQSSGKSLQHQESGHLRPARVNHLTRKHSDLSGSGSDPDSLVDLYNHSNGPSRNGAYSAMGEKRKVTANGAFTNDKKPDESKWIHRDKLAQIESKELEEAGFKVPTRRTMSRSESRERRSRSQSRNRRATNEEYTAEEVPPQSATLHSRYSSKDLKEERRQRLATPVMTPEEEVEEPAADSEDRTGWDLRTPEEIAAERERANSGHRSSSRPGGSRLPLARDSPIPVPHVVVERDSPLTRSRQGSTANGNSILEPAIVFTRPGRSGSIGSEALLDDVDESRSPTTTTPSPPRDSPSKAKSPTKGYPTGRKTAPRDRAVSRPKSRQGSGTTKRPGTSDGLTRPSTSHRRPEGEAPWIATMYKPDPSLPPDQQIIPTHAKKMAQEQWEKDGKTGSVYDREFRLLNADAFPRPLSKDPEELEPEKKQEDSQPWPTLPHPSPKPDAGRPGTSGGYKVIPTISSPQIPARSTPTPKPSNSPKPNDTIRLEDPGDDGKKQKKGCCCIVM